MDFSALLAVASKNNVLNEKLGTKSKSGYNTLLAPAKRQAPSRPKGVLSENVKAFLEKQEKEEKAKVDEEKKKKEALLKKRQEIKNKANAAAKKNAPGSKSSEEMREERERLVKEQLEEKRKAIIEKLKEAETKGGKRSSSASVSVAAPEYVSEKQRRADKKLMEKYDKDLDSDSDDDIVCDVLSPSKQILDREGYEKREMKRKKELSKLYKTTPAERQKVKSHHKSSSSKHKDKSRDKQKDKHKSKHKDKHRDKHDTKHKDDKHGKQNEKETKPIPKKPKFIRPNNNRPVLSFQDLLNMASKKQNEVLSTDTPAPGPTGPTEPIKKEKKTPKNERPMTQEEKDRYARKQTKEYKDWLKNGGVLAVGKSNQNGSPVQHESRPTSKQEPAKKPGMPARMTSPVSKRPSPERKVNGRTSLATIPVKSSNRPSSSAGSSQGSKHNQMRPDEKMPALSGAKRDSTGKVKKEEPKEAYTNPFDRIMGTIKKDHPRREKRPRVIDSEEEEEEDLDGFIDDDEDDDFIDDSEAQDYSSIIRNMFKYNPSKYKDEDDDLRSMEVGYAQIAQEEKRSAKIGLQEDLEDIRREKEEERRKMLLKKKMKLKMKGR